MHCKSCGYPLADEGKYCPNCGADNTILTPQVEVKKEKKKITLKAIAKGALHGYKILFILTGIFFVAFCIGNIFLKTCSNVIECEPSNAFCGLECVTPLYVVILFLFGGSFMVLVSLLPIMIIVFIYYILKK